jgi:hypothetical protein
VFRNFTVDLDAILAADVIARPATELIRHFPCSPADVVSPFPADRAAGFRVRLVVAFPADLIVGVPAKVGAPVRATFVDGFWVDLRSEITTDRPPM